MGTIRVITHAWTVPLRPGQGPKVILEPLRLGVRGRRHRIKPQCPTQNQPRVSDQLGSALILPRQRATGGDVHLGDGESICNHREGYAHAFQADQ